MKTRQEIIIKIPLTWKSFFPYMVDSFIYRTVYMDTHSFTPLEQVLSGLFIGIFQVHKKYLTSLRRANIKKLFQLRQKLFAFDFSWNCRIHSVGMAIIQCRWTIFDFGKNLFEILRQIMKISENLRILWIYQQNK